MIKIILQRKFNQYGILDDTGIFRTVYTGVYADFSEVKEVMKVICSKHFTSPVEFVCANDNHYYVIVKDVNGLLSDKCLIEDMRFIVEE